MTQQSDHCEREDSVMPAVESTCHFLTVNSARRRKNMQNRVSWHNSYAAVDEAKEEEEKDFDRDVTELTRRKDTHANADARINFRSSAMADVGAATAAASAGADNLSKENRLADSESTSSPSLFPQSAMRTTSFEFGNEPIEIQQNGLFSAPIIQAGIFSFENGRQATSAEFLAVIEKPTADKWIQDVTEPNDLPPEPLTEAPHIFEEFQRFFPDASNGISSQSHAISGVESTDVQHKRSASDHVTGTGDSTSQVNLGEDGELVRNETDRGRIGQTVLNIIESPPIDNRLSTSTPSINEKTKSVNAGILLPVSRNFQAIQSSSNNSNYQYKTAILNSAAEAQTRYGNGGDVMRDGFNGIYPATNASAATITGATIFKRGVLRRSFKKRAENNYKKTASGSVPVLCELNNAAKNINMNMKVENRPPVNQKPAKPAKSGAKGSISDFVDRITLKRQYSDGNLRRRFGVPSAMLISTSQLAVTREVEEKLGQFQISPSPKAKNLTANNLDQKPSCMNCHCKRPSSFVGSSMTTTAINDEKLCSRKNDANNNNNNNAGGINRRSFKWKSLFSTQKMMAASNKENCCWHMSMSSSSSSSAVANKNECHVKDVNEIGVKNRLKKSISLSYTIPSANGKTNLTPLIEETKVVNNRMETVQTSPIRIREARDMGLAGLAVNMEQPRPFSVIGCLEHDSRMLLGAYRINEENDRKFLEFLKLHDISCDYNVEVDDNNEDELSNSLLTQSYTMNYTQCSCNNKNGIAADTKNESSGISNVHKLCSENSAKSVKFAADAEIICPRHSLQRSGSTEKQQSTLCNIPKNVTQSASPYSNYNSLTRPRRSRRAAVQNANGMGSIVGVRRRQSICSANHLGVKARRSVTSPSPSSPIRSPNKSALASTQSVSSGLALRIQKRKMPANRRRSSINVNQVLSAIQQQREHMELKSKERSGTVNGSENNSDDVDATGLNPPSKLDEEIDDKFTPNGNNYAASERKKLVVDENAGRDALKAIIMRQHSIKQAAGKTIKADENVSSGLKWRKDARNIEKEKKRDSKTNSVILGTILSIRPKKKTKDTRSLANVFPFHNTSVPSLSNASGGMNVTRKDYSPGFFDRRSSHFSFAESKSGLPDVLSGSIATRDGHSSTMSSLTMTATLSGSESLGHGSTNYLDEAINSFPLPILIKPKWHDLELWADEPGTWSGKHSDVNLAAAEKKRQNVIYEIYITEKHHCQVIVFLQQAYQEGLKSLNILTLDEVKELIPDVLDSLLDFHLRLLRRIRERVYADSIVHTISDIIAEEFEEGEYRNAAINAYTNFCMAREKAHKLYAKHMERNANFRKFFNHYERDPEYKGRSFKSCLLLIAQRLTKYPLLIEQISKLDTSPGRSVSQRAHNAVKSFALKVDTELWHIELHRRWENLKSNLDKSSVGQLLGAPFSYDDLVHQNAEDPRKLLSISTVHWQSVTGQKIELSIIIFDDIVVLLQERNNVLYFFSQQDHASIIPLHTALIREMERTNEVMLIVLVKKKPDMYRLVFNNKTDMHNWISTFKQARHVAPQYVRTVRGAQHIDCGPPRSGSSVGGGGTSASGAPGGVFDDANSGADVDPDEFAYNANLQLWQRKLEEIFQKQIANESMLMDYIIARLRFFDDLYCHMREFPARVPRSDSGVLSATSRVRENRDIERMKSVLQARLKDLSEARLSTINQLIETAQRARDSDPIVWMDELFADGGVEALRREQTERLTRRRARTNASGTSTDRDNAALLDASASSPASAYSSSSSAAGTSSEEGAPGEEVAPFAGNESAARCKPRRARTYHGMADSQKGNTTSSTTARRHTTVPKVGNKGEDASGVGDEYPEQVKELMARLPLRVGSKTRRAATDLILENVAMRVENNKLRSEITLQDLHIASLRVKKTPVVETTEKLESLRQKHEEIQSQERELRKERERQFSELSYRQEQLERREAELNEREAQLKAFAAAAAAANFAEASAASTQFELQHKTFTANNNNCHNARLYSQTDETGAGVHRHSPTASSNSSMTTAAAAGQRPPTSVQQSQAHHQHHGGPYAHANSGVVPLANRPMTNLYGKLTSFRSGSAIHDHGANNGGNFVATGDERVMDRKMVFSSSSTLSIKSGGGNSPAANSGAEFAAQVPRHLAAKTETKPAGDKRKKK